MSMTARRDVFSSFELLENILRFLPTQSLLLTQQVCSTFRTIITTSRTLQKMLYFLPDDVSDFHGKRPFNPILMRVFPNLLRSDERQPSFFEDAAPANGDKDIDVFRRPQASWRHMLVTQPPLRHVRVKAQTIYMRGQRVQMVCYVLPVDQGLRMGTVYDMASTWLFNSGQRYVRHFSIDVYEHGARSCDICHRDAAQTRDGDDLPEASTCDVLITLGARRVCKVKPASDVDVTMRTHFSMPERDPLAQQLLEAIQAAEDRDGPC